MLAEARRRFAQNPGKYHPHDQPKIYGEHEVGGTSVLYISDISLDFLGWRPNLGDQPLPALTWAALVKVPPVVFGVAALMSGIYWVIGRRVQLQAEAAEARGSSLEGEAVTGSQDA
jgi:formate dehydrogenase iron-sulfur subunit